MNPHLKTCLVLAALLAFCFAVATSTTFAFAVAALCVAAIIGTILFGVYLSVYAVVTGEGLPW